jgi:hypothetical protein
MLAHPNGIRAASASTAEEILTLYLIIDLTDLTGKRRPAHPGLASPWRRGKAGATRRL